MKAGRRRVAAARGIAFDHVGHRSPVMKSENPQALWLWLVNNSRIPIQVLTFDLGTGDHEVGINYDVVVVPGLVDTPPPTTKPRGYSSEVGSPAVINPGRSLVFSIPRDHVSKWWYIQARFDLVLPTPREGTQPFSTVSFYWEGIPPKYREVPASISTSRINRTSFQPASSVKPGFVVPVGDPVDLFRHWRQRPFNMLARAEERGACRPVGQPLYSPPGAHTSPIWA